MRLINPGFIRLAGLLAVFFVWTRPVQANHRLGTLYVSPVLGHWMEYQPANLLENGPLWGARAGFDLCSVLGIEGFYMRGLKGVVSEGQQGLLPNSARYDAYGGGARINLPLGSFVPYLSVALGQAEMKFDYAIDKTNSAGLDSEKSEKRDLIIFGAGFEYFLQSYVGLCCDVHDHYLERDFIDSDLRGDRETHNWEFGAGVTILFGKVAKEAVDTDRDGVQDEMDECPDTPPEVAVTKSGCPVDMDSDGVPDYLDMCPDTPAGVQVDDQGCPLENLVVKEEEPVPLPDSDGDSVPDDLDLEPDTPRGAVVDQSGRMLDSDRDGVPDGIDQCPGTPASLPVDEKGCPLIGAEDFYLQVFFDLNSSQIKPGFYSQLEQLARLLKSADWVKLEIIGYADQAGESKNSLGISFRRAHAVRDYLTGEGVDQARLAALAGGKFPVEKAGAARARDMQRCVVVRLKK
ncbi:MAG TPA: OmpA family protein [archaeon]|nr:OmpA family protein [archaeon]